MKKLLIAAFAVVGFAAQAKYVAPAWDCSLDANVKGRGAAFVVGGKTLVGSGKIKCTDLQGNSSEKLVKVRIESGGFGFQVPTEYSKVHITSPVVIGLTSPEALLGSYSVVGPQVELTLGEANVAVGVGLSLRNDNGIGLGLNISWGAAQGLGLNFNLGTKVTLESATE